MKQSAKSVIFASLLVSALTFGLMGTATAGPSLHILHGSHSTYGYGHGYSHNYSHGYGHNYGHNGHFVYGSHGYNNHGYNIHGHYNSHYNLHH